MVVAPNTRQRWHDNEWVATIIQHEDGSVEGYLWDQHRHPMGKCSGGRDLHKTQDQLDQMAEGHGHTCSDTCGTWSDLQ